MKNHCSSYLAIILSLAFVSSCFAEPLAKQPTHKVNKYPEFSWGHIPRYMHVWKTSSYTNEELDYIAKFPLITFEKPQGTSEGSVQQGTLKAAQAIKSRNPKAKILY